MNTSGRLIGPNRRFADDNVLDVRRDKFFGGRAVDLPDIADLVFQARTLVGSRVRGDQAHTAAIESDAADTCAGTLAGFGDDQYLHSVPSLAMIKYD
ncbi:MAG: hypothetical protein H6646_03605 [Anaerolineales bacterium]|nr:hypothetical protein [Anaerolineales bacterium]